MSAHHLLAALQSTDVGAYDWTVGRIWATSAALLAVAGAVIGGIALARSSRRTGGRKGTWVALTAGLIAVAVGALNLAVADGGPGTGNGVVGGGVAIVVGLIALVLGGLALTRSRVRHPVG